MAKLSGILLLGPSGCGKSTLRRELEADRSFRGIEVSADILAPFLRCQDAEPGCVRDEKARQIEIFSLSKHLRCVARGLFAHRSRQFGPDWVAREIMDLVLPSLKANLGQPLVISGVRGLANVEYLRRSGFMLVMLHGDSGCFISRLSSRDQISLQAAEDDTSSEGSCFGDIMLLHHESHVVRSDLAPPQKLVGT